MANRAANITQSEVTRYAKAMAAAEVAKWRLVVHPNGSHELIVGENRAANVDAYELDKMLGLR